jgi:hypothetical protein
MGGEIREGLGMSETNLSISETAQRQLRELAEWAGVSVAEALERALRDQYDRQFWVAVNAGYAALRADPEAWAEVEAERRLWDATLMDGLDSSERWTDDDRALPPAAEPAP